MPLHISQDLRTPLNPTQKDTGTHWSPSNCRVMANTGHSTEHGARFAKLCSTHKLGRCRGDVPSEGIARNLSQAGARLRVGTVLIDPASHDPPLPSPLLSQTAHHQTNRLTVKEEKLFPTRPQANLAGEQPGLLQGSAPSCGHCGVGFRCSLHSSGAGPNPLLSQLIQNLPSVPSSSGIGSLPHRDTLLSGSWDTISRHWRNA